MKPIEELELRTMFSLDSDRYMIVSLDPLFESEKDMIYAIRLNGEGKGQLFDFPKGLMVEELFLFVLSNEIDISKIQQHNSIIYDQIEKKEDFPDKEDFKCFDCPETTICKFSFDLKNVNGKCLALTTGEF